MDNYQQRVYNADSSSKVDVSINDLKLWVEGFCLCGIKSLGPIFLDQRDPSQEMHWVRQMLSSLTFSVEHAKKKKKKSPASHTGRRCSPRRRLCSVKRPCNRLFVRGARNSLTSEDRKKVEIRRSLKGSILARRLLRTSNEDIGLTPSDAEVGDNICVF